MTTSTAMIMTTMIVRRPMDVLTGITTAIITITPRPTWAAPSPSGWD